MRHQVLKANPLFMLAGRAVYRNDTLYHHDVYKTGGVVKAEFAAEGDTVTVRTENGAVPRVLVSELTWEPDPDIALFRRFRALAIAAGYKSVGERDFRMWKLGLQAPPEQKGTT